MALLATQLDLEKYGHLDVTTEPDASITARLESASALIEAYCGRIFTSATVTAEVHDGGYGTVFLRQPPITSITTVVENSITLAATDYLFYPDGRLVRLSGGYPYVWYWKPRTVVVTYVGGYTPVPYDIRLVCVRIVERAFKAAAAWAAAPAGAGSSESERIGTYEISYADSVTGSVSEGAALLTDEEKETLDFYRIHHVA